MTQALEPGAVLHTRAVLGDVCACRIVAMKEALGWDVEEEINEVLAGVCGGAGNDEEFDIVTASVEDGDVSVIDDLKKPDYVERVEIKQFSLGDEPLSVRNVEQRRSRCVNDLQYQIGLRYTGGAHMLLMLTLKFRIIPIFVPVGVRDFDIDGELWVKLRLIPTEP
ncbi:hypothetical protein ACE6H2_026891 [Prunus campanulata]